MVFMFEKNFSQIKYFQNVLAFVVHGYWAVETYYKANRSLNNMKLIL